MTLLPCRHISVSISRPARDVYTFASDPRNLPKWASGLGTNSITFAEKNAFGVLDHHVALENGVSVYNPMRVVSNGDGSEVIFTLFRQSDMTDQKFEEDARWVEHDLIQLKKLLETLPP